MTHSIRCLAAAFFVSISALQHSSAAEIIYTNGDWSWGLVDNPRGQIAGTSNPDFTELTFVCNGNSCTVVAHLFGTCSFLDTRYTSPITAQFKIGGRRFNYNLYCVGNSTLNGVGDNNKVAMTTHPNANINSLIEAFGAGKEVSISVQYNNGNWTDVGFSLMGFTATVSDMLKNQSASKRSNNNERTVRGQVNR